MSKKNNLARRKKQHEFNLKREKEATEKREMKLKAKGNRMKIDGSKKTSKRRGFKVGKKAKLNLKSSSLAKAKAAQAMELDS